MNLGVCWEVKKGVWGRSRDGREGGMEIGGGERIHSGFSEVVVVRW